MCKKRLDTNISILQTTEIIKHINRINGYARKSEKLSKSDNETTRTIISR